MEYSCICSLTWKFQRSRSKQLRYEYQDVRWIGLAERWVTGLTFMYVIYPLTDSLIARVFDFWSNMCEPQHTTEIEKIVTQRWNFVRSKFWKLIEQCTSSSHQIRCFVFSKFTSCAGDLYPFWSNSNAIHRFGRRRDGPLRSYQGIPHFIEQSRLLLVLITAKLDHSQSQWPIRFSLLR